MPADAPMLQVENLSVTFGHGSYQVRAVRDVTFALGRERLGIVGESGSGKSTAGAKITCRLVAGQDPDRVFDAIEAHFRQHAPAGYQLEIRRQGAGSPAFALPADQPVLALTEGVLGELFGQPPLRVAMGATIPIGGVFRTCSGSSPSRSATR